MESQLLSVKLGTARFAEISQHVGRSVFDHLPNSVVGQCYRGLRSSVDNPSENLLGIGQNLRGRDYTHTAHFRIHGNERGNVGLLVLQRVDEAFRSNLDKLFVQILPSEPVLDEPLCPDFLLLGRPGAEERHDSDDCRRANGRRC